MLRKWSSWLECPHPIAVSRILRHPARAPIVATLSLAFTYLFFIEYLSPLRRVHIPFDLISYHYPLTDYAFLSLKAGRFPEWDWTIYCGQTFVGNIQAALFYPPIWLLFAVNIARPHVSYQSLQVFVIAQVWLAFLLCYVWLTGRQLKPLARPSVWLMGWVLQVSPVHLKSSRILRLGSRA